jgi:cytohesin
VKLGADVDARDNDDMTPLLWVSEPRLVLRDQWTSSVAAARTLLEHGASVYARNKSGATPLQIALRHDSRNLDIAELFLNFNAGVNAHDSDNINPSSMASSEVAQHGSIVHLQDKNGRTPLHVASWMFLPDIIPSLLKLGADVDAQDNNNMTPLHSALLSWMSWSRIYMRKSFQEVIILLLKHGANVHLQDDHGRTPLQIASDMGVEGLFFQVGQLTDRCDVRL